MADLEPADPNRYAGNAPSASAQPDGGSISMVSVIAIASGLCLFCAAALVLTRRRRVSFSGLDNIRVSRQWLIQHQADDHS
jgi:hypothetical protein